MRSTLHDPMLTAEHRLWRAVLEQAYVDAETGPDASDAQTGGGDCSHECLRARCYLRGDSKPDAAALVAVCSFAEIPADRVLTWARRNYPRPNANVIQHSLAIGVVGARDTRARCGATVSA